tara:strand:+ start:14141 stop:14494 length:354 start_codon:yes stop_codon:yes gene_type:complete
MPNYTQYGDSSYQFGIADTNVVDGMAVEQITIERAPEFEAEAKNDEGMTASFVRGDDKFTFTASGFLTNKALFEAGGDFTFDGQFFIINKKSRSQSNTDFQKCEISGVGYALISSES